MVRLAAPSCSSARTRARCFLASIIVCASPGVGICANCDMIAGVRRILLRAIVVGGASDAGTLPPPPPPTHTHTRASRSRAGRNASCFPCASRRCALTAGTQQHSQCMKALYRRAGKGARRARFGRRSPPSPSSCAPTAAPSGASSRPRRCRPRSTSTSAPACARVGVLH